jgi:preprotein translocase subunit SecA
MFEELNDLIREEVVRYLFHVEVQRQEEAADAEQPRYDTSDQGGDGNLVYEHESVAGADAIAAATGGAVPASAVRGAAAATATATAAAPARPKQAAQAQAAPDPYAGTGRNALCPCGSGKKYKKCHGA